MVTPTDEQVKDLSTSLMGALSGGNIFDNEVSARVSLPNTITEYEVVPDDLIETIKINWSNPISIEKVSSVIKNNPFNLYSLKKNNLIYWTERIVGRKDTDKKTILRGKWTRGAIKGISYEKEVGIRETQLQRVFYVFSDDSDIFPEPIYYMGAYDAPANTESFEAIWKAYNSLAPSDDNFKKPFVVSFIQQFLKRMEIEDYNMYLGSKREAVLINWQPLFHRLSESLGSIEWAEYVESTLDSPSLELVTVEMRDLLDNWIDDQIGVCFFQEGPDEYDDEGGWSMGNNWEKKLCLHLLDNNIVKRFVAQVVYHTIEMDTQEYDSQLLEYFLLSDCMVWVFALQLNIEDNISEHLSNYVE